MSSGSAILKPVDLKCEYMTNPIGIGERTPRLSWRLESEKRAQKQAAYRILVASTAERLARNEGDLWDSGKVVSDETVHIPYQGKSLQSRMRCYWKVLVWPEDSDAPVTSDIAFWEMGLLEPADWSAEWIGVQTAEKAALPDLGRNHWVGVPDAAGEPVSEPGVSAGGEQANTAYFRFAFDLPDCARVKRARFLFNADGLTRQYINGLETARHIAYSPRMQWVDLTYQLRSGRNVIALEVVPANRAPALLGRCTIEMVTGNVVTFDVDETWKVSSVYEAEWLSPSYDDSHWAAAVLLGKYGDKPWGRQVIDEPPAPASFMRRVFSIEKKVARARLYATAMGVYELYINGCRVGDAHFAPGWTDYKRRIMVQAYDVTDVLHQGENVLGAILGDGWYAGYIGFFGRHQYGPYPLGLLAQLEVTYEDGTSDRVVTDGSWVGTAGPIIESDFQMGEIYDARRKLNGWNKPGYKVDDTRWQPVMTLQPEAGELVPEVGPPIRTTKTLRPVAMTSPEPGVLIFDMGQNMVGRVRLTVRGARAGDCITVRHGEMLQEDGSLYTINLRRARQMDTYVCRGDEVEVYEPHFTFHGFRYVEVRGYPGEASLDILEGQVIHSDTPFTGSFECSHPLLNQLQSNIQWGQRGNFLSVPTDCPQRDERLGWTGDAQVFIRTACFNADTASFFTKWMIDVDDAQQPDGAFTDIAPVVNWDRAGTAAWGDAGVIVPWTLYLCYGDKRIIERHYEAMAAWVAYLERNSDGLIRPDARYGDWLSINADTPKDVIATAFFAYSTRLLARMAAITGKADDAEKYEKLFQRIKAAFNDRFVTADGRVKGDTQTAYLLALHMDLLPESLRPAAYKHLVADIKKRGNRLSTGFVGCPYLLPVLSEGGYDDVAYELITSTHYPSWGYSIEQGATTMWERWDSYKEGGIFQTPSMNSFNHYAYGSVGEWMYRYMAGLEVDPEQPAYKRVVIKPRIGQQVSWVKASYNSIRGPIGLAWDVKDGQFSLSVDLPANTTGIVFMPTSDPGAVTESGMPASEAVGVRFVGVEADERTGKTYARYEVASGRYAFTCPHAGE